MPLQAPSSIRSRTAIARTTRLSALAICTAPALWSACASGGSGTDSPGASLVLDAGVASEASDDSAGPPALGTPFQPTFGPTVTRSTPPPPISGGTLLVTRDGRTAVAADPDRDAIYLVSLESMSLVSTIALRSGDEPGRLVEDGAGRVHVALRGAGALVTIDLAAGRLIAWRKACPAPRGVAWDSSSDLVWVACATGELVGLPSAGGAATHTLVVERDLRDVIVHGGSLVASELRSAQLLHLGDDGSIARRDSIVVTDPQFQQFQPHVAWRAVAGASGSIVVSHQLESMTSLSTTVQGGYGGGGGGGGLGMLLPLPPTFQVDSGPGPTAVGTDADLNADAGAVADGGSVPDSGGVSDAVVDESAMHSSRHCDTSSFHPQAFSPFESAVLSAFTVIGSDGASTVQRTFSGVLPVDVAVSSDGSSVAIVTAGNDFAPATPLSGNLFYFSQGGAGPELSQSIGTNEQPIAVAFDPIGDVLVLTREPATLRVIEVPSGCGLATIPLSTAPRDDTGHDIFHTQAGGLIACASCHPEGGDDGHVWTLDSNRRRTPSLRGTIAGTAPYHWPGDQPNLVALVKDVYTKRMSGASLPPDQMGALTSWVQKIPAPPAPTWVDGASALRGAVIFRRAAVGCSGCHSGPKLTNNATMNVGTGGAFQVPPLVGVGWRTPLMHDGCAATIGDRFGKCATPGHGSVASLSAQDISDLTAYLDTL
jgi:hypothetical protein